MKEALTFIQNEDRVSVPYLLGHPILVHKQSSRWTEPEDDEAENQICPHPATKSRTIIRTRRTIIGTTK